MAISKPIEGRSPLQQILQFRQRASAWLNDARTREATARSRMHRFLAKNLQVVLLVSRWEVVQRLQLHAQSLTYDTLLALVPLLAVVFAVVSAFGGLQDLRQNIEELVIRNLSGSPDVQAQVGEYLHRFLGNVRTGSFSAISVVILIFSVMSLLGHIEFAFNSIFGVKAVRPWVTRLLTYWAALTLGPLLLGASFALTAGLQSSGVASFVKSLGLGVVVIYALPITVTWIAFTALYKLVPVTRVRLSSAIFAAIIAGSLWNGAKYLYAIYAKHAFTVQNIYGSLAAIPLFILWLYVSWLLVLLGAQLAFAFQHASTYYKEALGEQPNQTYRERVACRVYLQVARDFFLGLPPTDLDLVATDLDIPRRLLEGVVEDLKAGAYIREVHNGSGLVPATDLERVTVSDIITFMRTGLGVQLGMRDDEAKLQLDILLDEADRARERTTEVNFRQLVEKVTRAEQTPSANPSCAPERANI
jgi:membrane protein